MYGWLLYRSLPFIVTSDGAVAPIKANCPPRAPKMRSGIQEKEYLKVPAVAKSEAPRPQIELGRYSFFDVLRILYRSNSSMVMAGCCKYTTELTSRGIRDPSDPIPGT